MVYFILITYTQCGRRSCRRRWLRDPYGEAMRRDASLVSRRWLGLPPGCGRRSGSVAEKNTQNNNVEPQNRAMLIQEFPFFKARNLTELEPVFWAVLLGPCLELRDLTSWEQYMNIYIYIFIYIYIYTDNVYIYILYLYDLIILYYICFVDVYFPIYIYICIYIYIQFYMHDS